MVDYISRFQGIINQVDEMTAKDQVHAFIRGLAPKTRAEVGYRHPETLDEAITIATHYNTHHFIPGSHDQTRPSSHRSHFSRPQEHNDPMDINLAGDHPKKPYERRPMKLSEIECLYCHAKGHKSNQCEKRMNDEKAGSKSNSLYVAQSTNRSLMVVPGTLGGSDVQYVLDTGASTSVLSKRMAERLGIPIQPCETQIYTADGVVCRPLGKTGPLNVTVQNMACGIQFTVMNLDRHDALLGLDWLDATKATVNTSQRLLHFPATTICVKEPGTTSQYVGENPLKDYMDDYAVFLAEIEDEDITEDCWPDKVALSHETQGDLTIQEQRIVERLLKDNQESFSTGLMDLGTCNISKHTIQTTSDLPIFTYPYRKSYKERELIRDEVQKMLEAGIIRHSRSPWSSPVVLVPKKDRSVRFCIDYRRLNVVTVVDPFPIRRMDDILDRLQGSSIFSTLDLKSGYWQITMHEDSIAKTAFSTPDGHYEFLKLPFGIRNAPSDFCRIMQQVLGHLTFVEVYLDDITVHSSSFEEHMKHLSEVFTCLRQAGLKVNPEKCVFAKRSIKLLGHIVSGTGIEMDPAKVETVKNMKPPSNLKETQIFLGLTGYYRKFVLEYSKIAAPLFNLLKDSTTWNWSAECQQAFEYLKERLITQPILMLPDLQRPFVLFTDASGVSVGAILSQIDKDGKERVCCYASRILKGAEQHYGITEKECLAVVWAVKEFRTYLYGTSFQVITDHAALKWLMDIKDPTGRLARWAIYLQAFEFEIIHRKGTLHQNVDALSRPVLLAMEDADATYKQLDFWEDDNLLHFLQHGKHHNGLGKRHVKRISTVATHLKWEDDQLWYRKDVDDDNYLRVPGLEERLTLTTKAHLLGHFKQESTLKRLQERYYWPGMVKMVDSVIAQCTPCIRHQAPELKQHPAKSLTVSGIFDRIGIDLVLGLPECPRGYKGILVITEYLSKFPMAYPVKTKQASEVAQHLFDYISLFGPPKVILSDQGTEFVNETVNKLSELTGIERKVTSSYRPQTNGLTERFNKTLVESLRRHAEMEPSQWDLWIPYILFAYRTRINSSTGHSPFTMLYGRQPNYFEEWTGTDDMDEVEQLMLRTDEIRELFEVTHPTAMEKLSKTQAAQRLNTNRRNKTRLELEQLPIGSVVYVRDPTNLSKLQRRNTGPYKVIEVTALGNYWLEHCDGGTKLKKSYPRDRLQLVAAEHGEDVFEVNKILDHRTVDGKLEYQVSWKGYSDKHDSWIPEAYFDGIEVIEEYWNMKTRPAAEDVATSGGDL
jgi:hypothetical protein